MPSFRARDSKVVLGIYDVVGEDGLEEGFVVHCGLAANAGEQVTTEVAILDMGPPLHGRDGPATATPSVVGRVNLTEDEARKIQTFVDRHAGEHESFRLLRGRHLISAAPQMYCILPHASKLEEPDGRYVRMRFSCAGFVLEAYRKARVNPLDLRRLPFVGMDVIRQGYPREIRLLDQRFVRPEDLGLTGDGPWPVLMCGYLFHSLNRDEQEIRRSPYAPRPEDRTFL